MKKVTIIKWIIFQKASSVQLFKLGFIAVFLAAIPSISQSQRVILNEDFSDNHRKWEEVSNEHEFSSVKDGKYLFSTLDSSRWKWYVTSEDLKDISNWVLEADFSIDSIGPAGFFGVIWGAKDANNQLFAYYKANQKLPVLGIARNGAFQFFEGIDSFIGKRNFRFKIIKNHSRYYFLLNETPVAVSWKISESGANVGFILGPLTKVSADNFKITEVNENSDELIQDVKKFENQCFTYPIYSAEASPFLQSNQIDSAKIIFQRILMAAQRLRINNDIETARCAEAAACFYNAMIASVYDHPNGTQNGVNICHSCLAHYTDIYKTNKVWRMMGAEYELYSLLQSVYSNLIHNYDSSMYYLDVMESVSQKYPTSSVSHFVDINRSRARLYNWIGNYKKAAFFSLKAMSYFDSLQLKNVGYIPTNSDSSDYLMSVEVFLQSQKDGNGKSLKDRYFLIKKAEQIANSNPNFFLWQINLLLEESYLNRQVYDFRREQRCLLKAEDKIQELGNNNPNLVYFLMRGWLDYFQSLRNWNKVIEYNNKIVQLQSESYATPNDVAYFNAYWNNRDTVNSQRYFDTLLTGIRDNYYLLSKLDKGGREKYVDKFYYTVNDLRVYLLQCSEYRDNSERLFELSYLFKGLTGDVLKGNYLSFDTASHNIANKLSATLEPDEKFIDILSLINTVEDSIFSYVGFGIQCSADTTLPYPVIGVIAPFSNAYGSALQLDDTVISANNVSMKGYSGLDFYKHLSGFKVKDKLNLLLRSSDNSSAHPVTIVKDSVFWFTKKNYQVFAGFTISNNGSNKFSRSPDYEYNTDSTAYAVYPNYLRNLGNADFLYNNYASFLKEGINEANKLTFSLDGGYNKFNMETLPFPDSSGVFRFLGDLKKVKLIISPRDLLLKDTVNNNNKTIVLFGNPDYTLNKYEQLQLAKKVGVDTTAISYSRGGNALTGNYKFSSLPATKDEVTDIGQMLQKKGWQTHIYTGVNALEEQVKKLQSPRILHIATHGFFAQDIQPERKKSFMGMDIKEVIENPLLRSGLAFTGAERTRTDTIHELTQGIDDGILTAEEAQYLNLSGTELVVLSACETGLGAIINGEGVYGLQRAFRAAGAKSILMSLWNVNDAATEELMKSFYHHWLDDGLSKHDALWQAKLDLRKNPKYDTPYYWGAFVLIGE